VSAVAKLKAKHGLFFVVVTASAKDRERFQSSGTALALA